jgi:16S rRNA (uracil1498-N3)-methyltransferase
MPQLHAPQELGVWLNEMRHAPGEKFILLPGGASSLPSRPQGRATLLIGPEGGFTVDEASVA